MAGEDGLQRHLARELERLDVHDQRLRAPVAGLAGAAAERLGDQRIARDVADQVVAGEQVAAFGVVEDRVRGRVAGAVVDVQGAVGELERPAVGEDVGDGRAAAPAAVGLRHRAERGHHVARDAVAQHQRLREPVVLVAVLLEVLDDRDEQVERAYLGLGALGDDPDQPEVVGVLVGDDDPLEVLEPAAELLEAVFERDERLRRVRADVDERQRVVLDQEAVDSPDAERRGDGELVNARRHERMSASTSSRFRSMSCWDTRLSRFSRSSGSVLEGRTLKCQSS